MRGFLNKDQIENILSSQSIGRLACSDGLYPYIIPINYAYDGEYIYGQTNPGTKLEIMRSNPNVSFEAELVTNMRNWQSVVLHGQFDELLDEPAMEAWSVFRRNVFSVETITRVHNHEHEVAVSTDDDQRVKLIIFKISIEHVTGRYQRE